MAIDYAELRATGAERLDVRVSDDVPGQLEKSSSRIDEPVLIDCSEEAEEIYARGEDARRFCAMSGRPFLQLISTRGSIPSFERKQDIVLATWPIDWRRIEELAAAAAEHEAAWGMLVPVVFPVTTALEVLERLAAMAAANGATFFASTSIEVEASASRAIAQMLQLEGGDDDYAMLFHADPEPLQTATERHIAALAAEHGLHDFIPPPGWPSKSNWNGATLLMLTATRMIAMGRDIELAGLLARSARIVAGLDLPIERIAESASLSIIDALDDASIDILTDHIERGSSRLSDRMSAEWRLRRDYSGE